MRLGSASLLVAAAAAAAFLIVRAHRPPHEREARARLAAARKPVCPVAAARGPARGEPAWDPVAEIERARLLGGSPEEQAERITQLARQWARKDPDGAWNWLRRNAARMKDFADGALPEVVLETIAEGQPGLALRKLDATVAEGGIRGPFAAEVIGPIGLRALVNAGQVDLARAALDVWTQDPRMPSVGAAAYEVVAQAIGTSDPAAAGAWLESLPASSLRSSAVAGFAADWGSRDPVAALAWAQGAASSGDGKAALERTFNDWAERSPAQAADWLTNFVKSHPDAAEADRLVCSYINLSAATRANPELAVQLTALIESPDAQSSELNRIRSWTVPSHAN